MQTSNNAVKNVKVPKKRKPRRHTLTDIDLHILGLIALSSGRPISKKEFSTKRIVLYDQPTELLGALRTQALLR